MADEIISQVKRFLRGIEVRDETLAVDAINRVGPGGNFLIDEHTLRHFKQEVWYPKYFDRRNYAGWDKAGKKSLGETLNEKVKWVLENHQPEPLDPAVKQAVEESRMRWESCTTCSAKLREASLVRSPRVKRGDRSG